MKKLRNNIGMTMAEMLIVVAIIVILCGVAFIAVWNYQRSMGQLERDGIAKEIFVAAQNHLTAAYGEGYLGLGTDNSNYFGTEDTETKDADGKDIVGDYYYTVNGGSPSAGVFEQMLPFGSVDETVRAGGSYIIHYQKDTGLVMDVFYCTRSGSPTRFNVESLKPADYSLAMKARGSKDDRRTGKWLDDEEHNGPILGYYGGTDAASLPTATLQPPSITVHNEEKLYVEVTNPNKSKIDKDGNPIASLQLIIKGVDSKAQAAIILQYPVSNASKGRVITRDFGDNFTVILDDITTSGLHFANLTEDTENSTGNFIPGEDIEIQAVAYSTKALVNIAYSAKSTTNSLFGSINSTKNTAYIGNIRHLENLDKTISNLDDNDTNDKIKIDTAEQTDNFSWVDFQKAVRKIETKSTTGTESDTGYESVGVYDFSGTGTVKDNKGYFMPIQPNYTLTYNGKNHSISDVSVDITGHAGLFGSTSSVTAISDLELIDFSVVGTTSAGALAGTLENCTVKNVLARNKDNSEASLAKKITATTDAGGLIGKLTSGTVQYSAAAVFVGGSSTTNAGGLIGSASGTIEGCYSGGHTQNGDYKSWVDTDVTSGVKRGYDVNGATAGGLVGSSDAEISCSYSTCSVSGTTAGGFAGNANGSITDCYATGLVNGTTQFAFVAAGSPSLSGDHFYRVINEVASTKPGAKEGETEPMLPVSGYTLNSSNIKPIDLNADTYNEFTGAWASWNPARAFDSTLMQYYSGSYTLRTVDELIGSEKPEGYDKWDQLFVYNHYGDWPSPEVFFIN